MSRIVTSCGWLSGFQQNLQIDTCFRPGSCYPSLWFSISQRGLQTPAIPCPVLLSVLALLTLRSRCKQPASCQVTKPYENTESPPDAPGADSQACLEKGSAAKAGHLLAAGGNQSSLLGQATAPRPKRTLILWDSSDASGHKQTVVRPPQKQPLPLVA